MSNKGQLLQDPFLNTLRREHVPVSIYLVNGIKLQGQIMQLSDQLLSPTQLRQLTGGAGEIAVEAGTVGEALRALDATNPGFGERIFDEAGALRRFVNVFVAEEDVRFLQGLDTPLSEGVVISIVPAVAGG